MKLLAELTEPAIARCERSPMNSLQHLSRRAMGFIIVVAIVCAGCAFGPAMYFRAIDVSKLGPDDIERLDTKTRTGTGILGPPYSIVFLRTRATVAETVRVYRQRLRALGWQEWDRLDGWTECWFCVLECRQGRACHLAFTSPDNESVVGFTVTLHNERSIAWPEKLKSQYAADADKYTWVTVGTSN